ncbi:MAG: hypothetical protein IJV76_09720, partial [Clostridia bacterium]|nr:hypothetical protein [Clostridia bacterium]
VGKTGVYIGGIELAAVGYYIYDTETDTLNTGSEEDHNAYLTWDEENGYVLTIKDLTVEQDSSAADDAIIASTSSREISLCFIIALLPFVYIITKIVHGLSDYLTLIKNSVQVLIKNNP